MIPLTLVAATSAFADVPPPRPVPAEAKLGCYYFPGHFHPGRWSPMKSYGHPVPLLGHYRDGAPGVMDWHIKWALEHGISYFAFDWYYDYHTGRVADHNRALDEGFLKAQYRDRMEFAIFWCNEEPRTDPSYTEEQMLTLARTLGERYLQQPSYLRIEGRRALFVSEPMRLWDSFGPQFRKLLPRLSRAAGLPEGQDLFLVGKQSGDLDKLAEMGFSACTAYNYAGTRVADTVSPLRATYDDMVEAYEMMWKRVTADGRLPYIVPVSPGWDSRPWYGPQAFVRTGATPARFRDMCERARRYVDPKLNMAIAECWNEFGEGSFLEPTQEHGFAPLDALREVFCRPGDWPPNVAPSAEEVAALAWSPAEIPDDPRHSPPDLRSGNLLPFGDMEEGSGWLTFDQAPAAFTTDEPHAGRSCLTIDPDRQAKSASQVGLLFGRTYEVAAWVRCSPGASVRVTAALFSANGRWIGQYHDLGETDSQEWVEVRKTVPALDPSIGAIDVEFVATGGPCWADGVSISVTGDTDVQPVFEDSCRSGEGWVLYDGGPAQVNEGGLLVPEGTGVKTRALVPAGPEVVYSLRARIRCEEKTTLRIASAEIDAGGKWLGSYSGGGDYNWPDWIEVTSTVGFRPDSQAKQCDIEFVALGGRAWVRDVRLFRGQPLPRR